jgi:hypothetical protein
VLLIVSRAAESFHIEFWIHIFYFPIRISYIRPGKRDDDPKSSSIFHSYTFWFFTISLHIFHFFRHFLGVNFGTNKKQANILWPKSYSNRDDLYLTGSRVKCRISRDDSRQTTVGLIILSRMWNRKENCVKAMATCVQYSSIISYIRHPVALYLIVCV